MYSKQNRVSLSLGFNKSFDKEDEYFKFEMLKPYFMQEMGFQCLNGNIESTFWNDEISTWNFYQNVLIFAYKF